ncbi:MAG: UDP-N-acetylglucosamine 2-epimerase (non-hydrolyzing) [bacterium]|nr:UDP-N-acetylglucosamine 2-epimerase (non-hydrolyzing) [bacterium]
MKILSVVGARPQFVKLAPLSRAIRGCNEFEEIILHTGQHYNRNMSDNFFEDLRIPSPDYNLNIGSGKHGEQTGKMLSAIEEILIKELPRALVVFGDTNSTLAGALAAVKLHIPVIHIEAGLRSFNREMPEEINRVAVDHISDFLFAPTQTAMEHLQKEGLAAGSYLTGDIMVDAIQNNIDFAENRSTITDSLNLENNNFHLLTLHRPYNVDNPETLKKILAQLAQVDKKILFPIHPRTKKILQQNSISTSDNIILSDPLSYLDFIKLENHCAKIITDSGGIQKEAYILKKPCITIRFETEWVETVHEGWNILADAHSTNLAQTINSFTPPKTHPDIFGQKCAAKMVGIIKDKVAC